ncbi:transcriptional regulator family: Fungal Specific TF [Aspergillus niger]|nr:transcriptional regulator family: Fungal Specific TF [Aspergillus niger]
MFDHFLNDHENRQDWIDKCSITYLGESFPLAIVLGGPNNGSRPKLHHLGPPFPTAQEKAPLQSPPTHIPREDLEYLRAKDVLTLPEKAHLDALISVFLDHVYPLYPIVNRQEFIQEYKNDHLSLILMYAISFIAVTFAPQSVVSLLGFETRPQVRSFFYKKAKALFDMGYETNKITVLQSTFFLSFYGGGPNTYWNFYSWVSTAVTIAEAIGIHRSTVAVPNMQPQDKSLMRRLWWALVVRDSICGTLVGRQFRIDLDQADADMLTIGDFVHDAVAPDFLENPFAQRYAQYQIETAKLSQIMREIIISRFYPGRQPVSSEILFAHLARWKADLVSTLSWNTEVPDPSNTFSMSLSVQYSHHLILIYLGHMRGEDTYRRDEREVEEIIDSAAHHISSVVCMLVTKSAFLSVPHELYHGIFLAQAAFYVRMKSSNKLVSRLGRSAHNSCQMVLKTIGEFWDCGTFILQLFENLSSRCLEQPSGITESGTESRVIGGAENSGVDGTINSANEAGVLNALMGDDRWQGNPMLESLFDLPSELFLPE